MQVRRVFPLALAVAAAFSFPNPAPAAPRPITLEECVAQAISKNLDLQIQQRSLDIANYTLAGAYGAYTPTLSLQARREHLDQPLSVDYNNTGIDYPYDVDSGILAPALTGRLPFGTEYSLGANFQEDDVDTFFGVNTNLIPFYPPRGVRTTNSYYADAGLTVRQPLLRDFWINSARQTVLLRKHELKMSEQALLTQIMSTVLAVELAYYDLIAAREGVRVQEFALGLKQKAVADTRRRVQAGDLPELETQQAETQFELTRTKLAAAREELGYRQTALKALITDSFASLAEVDLEPADPLAFPATNVNRSESFRRAMSSRPDLAEARIAVERSSVVVKFQRNQLFPALDLVGRYGGLGIRDDMSSAASDAINLRNKEYYYGVVVSIPLGAVAERNNYRTGKAQRDLAELQLKKAEQEVLVQVADSANRVTSRYDQVDSARKARVFAENALAAEEKKLDRGLSTVFVVLQLQETLTDAQLAEAEALVDYNKALAQLTFSEGGTMEKHRLLLQSRK